VLLLLLLPLAAAFAVHSSGGSAYGEWIAYFRYRWSWSYVRAAAREAKEVEVEAAEAAEAAAAEEEEEEEEDKGGDEDDKGGDENDGKDEEERMPPRALLVASPVESCSGTTRISKRLGGAKRLERAVLRPRLRFIFGVLPAASATLSSVAAGPPSEKKGTGRRPEGGESSRREGEV
jgi:hypothetical protein